MLRCLIPALFVLTLFGCAEEDEPGPAAQVTIIADVPTDTGAVYLTGSDEQFGPWDAAGVLMVGDDTERRASVILPTGTDLQYKFTLGDWSREAVDDNGFPYPNFSLIAEDGMVVAHRLGGFKPELQALLDDWQGSGVIGTLVHETNVKSAFLALPRNVTVWLPPGYSDPANQDQRYRVIYMTDGENLFDPRIANTGIDWGVDEAMARLVEANNVEPAIIVATWSTAQRLFDYSPWHNGPDYARMLIEEVKPHIDAGYRTRPGREDTFAMGSSMGGLMATYLVTQHSDTFSACGCVSTHVTLSEAMIAQWTGTDTPSAARQTYLDSAIAEGRLSIPPSVRMFFDYGTKGLDADYGPGHDALRAHLKAAGLTEGAEFLIKDYPNADHNEASWRARVGDQLAWLLAERAPQQ
ncbi:MAG: alpha/beta hydrolase-fold protein [Pseudomonadota bacterium]